MTMKIAVGLVGATVAMTIGAWSVIAAPRVSASTDAGSLASQAPTTSRSAATARVRGVVVADSRSTRSAGGALVLIAGTDVGVVRVTAADDGGRFEFDSLAPGHYLLAASKPAYLASLYGANRTGQAGDLITLAAGETRDHLTITMPRGAVVAGVVMDEAGQPVMGARIRVLPRRQVADEIALAGDAGDPPAATTDDRGMYRIFDVPPGAYVIAVTARGLTAGDTKLPAGEASRVAGASAVTAPTTNGASVGFAPIFFPDAATASRATIVTLLAGETREHVDLRVSPARFARVDGTLQDADGSAPTNVTIRPRGWDAAGAMLYTATVRTDPSGRFAFTNVPPGDYTVFARTPPPPAFDPLAPPAPQAATRWTSTDIVVRGDDQSIALTWQPALSISGHVTFAGLARPPSDITVRVGLRATPGSNGARPPLPAIVGDDGRFTLTDVVPGRYWVTVSVPASPITLLPEWISSVASIDGHDAFDLPMTVAPDVTARDLSVTLTRETQQIDGVVKDHAGRPAPNCPVVVFSTDPRAWFAQSRRIALRPTNDKGELLFNVAAALPPGEYYVAVVPGIRSGQQFDPWFLADLAHDATRVMLDPGGSRTVSIVLPRPVR